MTKEEKKAYDKAYREANREKLIAQSKAYREANKERVKAADKAWREANKERVAAMNAAGYLANKEKRSVQGKEWYQRNKERQLQKAKERYERVKDTEYEKRSEQAKRSRERTKDKIAEYQMQYNKVYNELNKARISELGRSWRKNNPHKTMANGRLRSLKLKQAIPVWYEDELVASVYKKRDELNERYGLNLQVDHIIPLNPNDESVCGLHCWANLQLLDGSLNCSKLDKYQTDW